jgi:hypothetical protein
LSVALLLAALCSAGRGGERELAAELYAAGEAALAAGQWDLVVIRLWELYDRTPGYRNATHCFGPNFRAGFRCAGSVGP